MEAKLKNILEPKNPVKVHDLLSNSTFILVKINKFSLSDSRFQIPDWIDRNKSRRAPGIVTKTYRTRRAYQSNLGNASKYSSSSWQRLVLVTVVKNLCCSPMQPMPEHDLHERHRDARLQHNLADHHADCHVNQSDRYWDESQRKATFCVRKPPDTSSTSRQ